MTPGDSMADGLDTALIALFAETTSGMMTLWEILHSNPAVSKATQGCDIRKYRRLMTEGEGEVYAFESYVESETHGGEQFYWLLDITREPSGWVLHRNISKQYDGGAQPVQQFDDFRFASFDELASKHANLMNEFIKSADNFDFSQ
jgi:hypothetical protein